MIRLIDDEDGSLVGTVTDEWVREMLFDGRLNVGLQKMFAKHLGLDINKVWEARINQIEYAED